MAVSTSDNGVKIIANTDGIRLLRAVENRPFDTSGSASAAIVKVCLCIVFPQLISSPLTSCSLCPFSTGEGQYASCFQKIAS